MRARAIELADVEAAQQRIRGLAVVTPTRHSIGLSRLLGARVSLKMESMQPTGAFKLRGAANAILNLSEEARQRGVIAQSSGNHGRAVAYVASQLGIPAVICLSRRTPSEKIEAVRALDVEVVVEGADQMEAMDVALSLAEERGLTVIPPFDDRHVIAGQGTIGIELLEQYPELETIIVPVSGGGLASGVAMAVKSLRPELRVVGVSQENGAAMYESLKAGRLVEVEEEPTWADALAGGLPFDNRWTINMCRQWLDEIRLVSEDEIAAAMVYALRHEHIVLEGGAAVGLALLLTHPTADWGGDVTVICTGDNVDIDRLLDLVGGETEKETPS
jgi:threonine dehydratase